MLVRCLYGLDNFYYRRLTDVSKWVFLRLYGLDNFYYRRSTDTKLLQKSGIRKNEVIELIYRGFI